MRMMHDLGLLESILPEVAACDGVPQDEVHHPEGDVLEHTFRVLENLRRPDFPLALAALLHDVAKPRTRVDADRIRFHGHDKLGAEMAEAVCRRLKLSRHERERVKELVGRHMLFINIKKMRESRLRRFVESEGAADHIELHRADCLASHGKLDNLRYISAMKGKWARRPMPPDPLLTGRDLLEMGFAQGPRLGRILREVENLQLEGQITTSAEAREHVAANHEPGIMPDGRPEET
jgi:poly(A) polymerase